MKYLLLFLVLVVGVVACSEAEASQRHFATDVTPEVYVQCDALSLADAELTAYYASNDVEEKSFHMDNVHEARVVAAEEADAKNAIARVSMLTVIVVLAKYSLGYVF